MSKLVLAPIGYRQPSLEIDREKWSQQIGDGGFGVTFGCVDDPHHILKCMDEEVSMVDAQPAMLRLSRHSKVMTERLSNIVSDTGTNPFARSICQTLLSTLTTHVGYSTNDKRIYLFQCKAPGQSLEATLKGDPPSWDQRVRIAKSFASVMFALRRCNVVHLDCRPMNVFVDTSSPEPRVTLIDLDGCGVLFDRESENVRDVRDAWQTPPMTMGRAEDMYRPIWFPWDPTWQTPIAGNFKFAERWCVISEVWKILSWGTPALGWLEPQHDALLEASGKVQEMYKANASYLPNRQQDYLTECQRAIANELKDTFSAALEHTKSIQWVEYGLGSGAQEDEELFSELGVATLMSFRNPRDKRLPTAVLPPHSPEIPSAQWIQKALYAALRRYDT